MDNTDITNEQLQVIEVLGRKALFIKDHVVQRYLPNGLYAYDFQAEDGNPFAALVLCALVAGLIEKTNVDGNAKVTGWVWALTLNCFQPCPVL